jgi:xylulokinase
MHEWMLGVDLGTSGLKAVLLSSSGELIAEASQEYPTHYPHPNWAEQEPEDWWRALCTTVRRVMDQAEAADPPLAGICVSSQAPVIVSVARDGQPLMRGMLWLDKRAEAECDVIRAVVSEERIRQITANNLSSYLGAPNYVWLKRHRPDIFEQTHKFLMANSYINLKLTGQYTMDVSQAPLQLLADAKSCDWSPELLDALDLPVEKFPKVYQCLEIIGQVQRQPAEELGIPAGVPVLAGTTDTPAGMVGMGVVQNGQAFVSHGTGCNIGLCVAEPRANRHLVCIPHAIPGRWMLSAVMTSTGASMKWFVNELCARDRDAARAAGVDAYSGVTASAETSSPGSGGLVFLPYLMGEQAPIWDADARGVFVGISANTTRGDMVRAIMEGIAFGIRQNLQVYLDDGWQVGDIRVQGGAARNPLWNQILSDVTGRAVLVPPASGGAPIGDALLVGLATGIYPDVEAAMAVLPGPSAVHHPNPPTVAIYNELYPIYERLYGVLRDTFHNLALIRATHSGGRLKSAHR